MQYKKMNFSALPGFQAAFLKQPHETYLSMQIGDGEVVAAPGQNEELRELPQGVSVYHTGHNGGTIVGFPGSITLFAFTNRANAPRWREQLAAYLQSRGLNAAVVDNDVLVDGFKVAGFMSKWVNREIQYFGCHISIHVDLDVIQRICRKPMVKIPKGLGDYGVTREMVLEALDITESGN